MPRPSGGISRREPCARCGLPVFIAERLNVGKQLYHRTCFRCARCDSQLTLANYYETETTNQFCCETCPDEEQNKQIVSNNLVKSSVLTRSLSDEEKSVGLQKFDNSDDYSANFENMVEVSDDKNLTKYYSPINSEQSEEVFKARSLFISSQLAESEDSDSDTEFESKFPKLPSSEPPDISKDSENNKDSEDISSIVGSVQCASYDSGYPSNIPSLDLVVECSKEISKIITNQPETANEQLDTNKIITKENKFPETKREGTSLVKSRMLLFENIKPSDLKDNFSTKSPEEKFIPKVLFEEEHSTGSHNKIIDLERIESNNSVETSVEAVKLKNDESHMDETVENSIIVISSEESHVTLDEDSSLISNKSQSTNVVDQYPEDLNPFGDEDEENDSKQNISVSLNPFDSDDDEEDSEKSNIEISPKPAVRRKIKRLQTDMNETIDHLDSIYLKRISYNPYVDQEDAKSTLAVKNESAKISLNPFWSDGEEPEDEIEVQTEKPVPLPRVTRSLVDTPEPRPRKLLVVTNKSIFGSNTSLSSAHSSTGATGRKKKPAPQPPTMDTPNSEQRSCSPSPSTSVQHSPKLTPKIRKIKKAPEPPSKISTPQIEFEVKEHDITINDSEHSLDLSEWEKEKNIKDEVNRNRQSQIITDADDSLNLTVPNKSTYGKWKRRKGPAPSRPIPQRRSIKPLPVVEIKRELEFIEIQQQGLEKQGVRLEQIIREKCEGPNADSETSLSLEVEDLILQLFELVNEKNELFRKQTELMYLRRQQRLEEEYADLEYQIRCLMIQPEANKTDSDKAREEELISRLVEVVGRRNEIVECLEMDRVREAEEDDSINNQLNLYVSKREDEAGSVKSECEETKLKKKNKKKFKFKFSKKLDADKDIDECESSKSSPAKDKKKKKFSIF